MEVPPPSSLVRRSPHGPLGVAGVVAGTPDRGGTAPRGANPGFGSRRRTQGELPQSVLSVDNHSLRDPSGGLQRGQSPPRTARDSERHRPGRGGPAGGGEPAAAA